MNRKILFILLGVVIVTITILIINYLNFATFTRNSSRHVVDQVNFKYLWSSDNTFIGGNTFLRPSGYVKIEKDFLLLLIVQRRLVGQDWKLRKQILETGEIIWEIDFGSKVIKGVINDSTSIFVASSIQRACGITWEPSCEAIMIISYDIGSGDENWSEIYDGMLNIEWIEIDNKMIEMHGSANRGNHRDTFRVDINTGELIWSGSPILSLQEIREKARQQPEYFVPQEVTSPVISNVAECDKILYFVTANGMLWATEQDSRSIIGMIDFSPKEHDMNIFDAQVLCDNFVVVYFEDSLQIFTFSLITK